MNNSRHKHILTGTTKSATILVVDDQQHNIQVVGATLAALGFEVMAATSGEQALTRVENRIPDLILLDVCMPGMDGVELCEKLKANPETADIPIIFLSAADETNIVVRALEAGGVDYVTKPFNKAELLARVRTHLALKQTRDDLADLLNRQEEFISTIAHDLKNPLGGVKFSAQMLTETAEKTGLPERSVRLAHAIQDGTERALGIIDHLLTEADTAQSEIELSPALINLSDCIESAVSRFLGWSSKKSISLNWQKPEVDIHAQACPHALARVLDNMVSNSIKFSPEGKEVSISLETGAGNCSITIADQGPGFTKEDRKSIFERFTRLSARPTGGEPSTGLGLSISKRLVERMNGKLTLDSDPGEGARFVLKLPTS
jgi:two-component system sensor histidine kinase/response regulator